MPHITVAQNTCHDLTFVIFPRELRWTVYWCSLSIFWLAVRNKTHPLKKPRCGRSRVEKVNL